MWNLRHFAERIEVIGIYNTGRNFRQEVIEGNRTGFQLLVDATTLAAAAVAQLVCAI